MSAASRETPKLPKGVVAIAVRGDGSYIASAAHFGLSRPGGFTLREAQDHYARDALANAVVLALCADEIAEMMRGYDAQQLLGRLCAAKGYRVHLVPIGYDEATA